MSRKVSDPRKARVARKASVARFPQQLERQVLYDCPWLTLYRDRVLLPDGRLLPEYHVVKIRNGVGVLVEDPQGRLLFEQVYRYPTQRLEWAIPAGGIEDGEDPLQAARREVFEETGYETYDHRLVYAYHPMNGIADQTFYLVRCTAGEQAGSIDRGEIMDFRWMARPEALAMVRSGEMMDGLTLAGVLLDPFSHP